MKQKYFSCRLLIFDGCETIFWGSSTGEYGILKRLSFVKKWKICLKRSKKSSVRDKWSHGCSRLLIGWGNRHVTIPPRENTRLRTRLQSRLGITNFVGKLQNVDFGDAKYGQTEARQLAASKELLHWCLGEDRAENWREEDLSISR